MAVLLYRTCANMANAERKSETLKGQMAHSEFKSAPLDLKETHTSVSLCKLI